MSPNVKTPPVRTTQCNFTKLDFCVNKNLLMVVKLLEKISKLRFNVKSVYPVAMPLMALRCPLSLHFRLLRDLVDPGDGLAWDAQKANVVPPSPHFCSVHRFHVCFSRVAQLRLITRRRIGGFSARCGFLS